MAEKIFLNKKNKALPYSLNALRVQHFQGIKYLEIADLPCDAQWIFLTGENGFGKTSVLRSIAKGLAGDDFPPFLKKEEKIHLYFMTNKGIKINEPIAKQEYHDVPIVAYGVSRFNEFGKTQANSSRVYSLFNNDGVLENIEEEIKDYYDHKTMKRRFELIEHIFKKIIPILEKITVEDDDEMNIRSVFYYEKLEDGNSNRVRLSQLATGHRNILAIIGDMIVRINRKKVTASHIDFTNEVVTHNVTSEATIDAHYSHQFEGIVLIDEFDAHLHPKYQYELPKLLSDVFPKVQFIVSTHSPIPLLGAPKDSAVVLKVNRTAAEGIIIERMDEKIPFDHLQPNALLTSPIFGFADLFPRRPASEVLVSHHWQDIQEDFNLQKELDELKKEGLL